MMDQFPWREEFLRLKACNQYYVFRQKDNHDIFIKNGTAVAISYPFAEGADKLAAKKMSALMDTYFQDMNIYLSVISDKAYFLAEQYGYPSIDYDLLVDNLRQGCPQASYIDLFTTLCADDYYKTDAHWKQDCLQPTVSRLISTMGRSMLASGYIAHDLYPFHGVYCGQSALPLKPDTLTYLTSELLDKALCFRATNNSEGFEKAALYAPEKIKQNDPFDVFLGGACSVCHLVNTCRHEDHKVLYLFSDSFGRSIAPQLLESYHQVWLIDIRYIRASRLPELIDFQTGSDVLFLYSIETLATASSLNTD